MLELMLIWVAICIGVGVVTLTYKSVSVKNPWLAILLFTVVLSATWFSSMSVTSLVFHGTHEFYNVESK